VAKTYNTISTFVSGAILTAVQMNGIGTNVNNYRVPTMCSVYRSAALSQTSNGGYQSIAWDNQDFTQTDTGMWSAGTNPSRITLTTAGLYVVTLSIGFAGNATGWRTMRIDKNGTAVAYGNNSPGWAIVNYLNMNAIIQSDGDDYVEALAYQDSGGNLAYSVGQSSMRFSAVWVGQAS